VGNKAQTTWKNYFAINPRNNRHQNYLDHISWIGGIGCTSLRQMRTFESDRLFFAAKA
jgi:hypothetical protein